MSLIEIENLTKTYQVGEVEICALNGVSLTIESGEFVAVMGSSGSGKSTLMNILGCLDRPSNGRYLLAGEDVERLSESELAAIRSRRIGFVFQNFNLLSRTSAFENVELPLFYSGWSKASARRAGGLLESMGMGDRQLNHPNQLSGGQQQRVAIARALVNSPALLLADEPTGNLDSKSSVEIMEILKALNRDHGLTVVVVTHDPEVAAYVERVITLRDGKVVSDLRSSEHGAEPAYPRPAEEGEAEPATAGGVLTFGTMALSAACRALWRSKMRAALTMLGIFIGVAAVITLVALGDGARTSVTGQIQSLGTNMILIIPGASTSNGVKGGFGSKWSLRVADAEAVAKQDRAVALVSYVKGRAAQVVRGNRNWSTRVQGTTPDYLPIRDWGVELGRPFTRAETKTGANVCLLGKTVVRKLFGERQNPVGATIRVRNFALRVIGVLSPKGQAINGEDQDDIVLIPFRTAERKVLGGLSGSTAASSSALRSAATPSNPFGSPPKITGRVGIIFVKARSAEQVGAAVEQITRTIRLRHRIGPGEDDDFTVRSLDEITRLLGDATRTMTILLAAIASISLLVGGIGIMNIMLVSVTERTREIGLRMAVGARRLHVMLQFLVEAMVLSLLGGGLGIGLGIGVSKVISHMAGLPAPVSLPAVLGGFLFSAAVGVFFGYYPARKASMLRPIDALRYE